MSDAENLAEDMAWLIASKLDIHISSPPDGQGGGVIVRLAEYDPDDDVVFHGSTTAEAIRKARRWAEQEGKGSWPSG